MRDELNLWTLMLDASWVVQLVLLALLLASVLSWTLILRKQRSLRKVRATSDTFEKSFWSGGDVTQIYDGIRRQKTNPSGMQSIFAAGFDEFGRLRQQPGLTPDQIIEGAQRTMRVSQMREIDRLEESLSTLATIGSTSPYVGLFGTVWGIMLAIYELGTTSTISTLAPKIVEALVPTAAGLFAAIPATVAYNRFADQVDRLENRFDTFMEEFATILQRMRIRRTRGSSDGPGQKTATDGRD
ncbi:MAG: protein TolQ [Gammaproteobacteria bacterium]